MTIFHNNVQYLKIYNFLIAKHWIHEFVHSFVMLSREILKGQSSMWYFLKKLLTFEMGNQVEDFRGCFQLRERVDII